MIITVDVTQEDIDNGSRLSCVRCPVAAALQRSAGRKVYCSDDDFCFSGSSTFVGLLPGVASEFITAFDQGQPVKPFTFCVSIPDKYLPPSVLEAQR